MNTGNSHQNVNLTGHSTLEVSLQTIFFFAVIAIEHPSTVHKKRERTCSSPQNLSTLFTLSTIVVVSIIIRSNHDRFDLSFFHAIKRRHGRNGGTYRLHHETTQADQHPLICTGALSGRALVDFPVCGITALL